MEVVFSKRMQSTPVMLFVFVFVLAVIVMVVRNLTTSGYDPAPLIPLLSLFTVLATIGWRAVLRSESSRWVLTYFVAQNALLILIFLVENILSGGRVALAGNLSIILMVQVAVLPWSFRWLMLIVQTGLLSLVVLQFRTPDVVVFSALISLMLNGAITLTGHLVVSEEKAHSVAAEANRKLAEYAAQAEELATMRERNRLAREIHDNLGHYLTVVNTQIEAARIVMNSDPARSEYLLERAQSLTREGLGEIRRSVAALRAETLEIRRLPDAIRALIDEHAEAGLRVDYRIEGEPGMIDSPIEMALYRVAQEGLTNIRKHARAASAELRLRFGSDRIALSLHDDGVGSAEAGSGFGLMGLEERIRLLGGTFRVTTAPGAGFTLQVEVPA